MQPRSSISFMVTGSVSGPAPANASFQPQLSSPAYIAVTCAAAHDLLQTRRGQAGRPGMNQPPGLQALSPVRRRPRVRRGTGRTGVRFGIGLG